MLSHLQHLSDHPRTRILLGAPSYATCLDEREWSVVEFLPLFEPYGGQENLYVEVEREGGEVIAAATTGLNTERIGKGLDYAPTPTQTQTAKPAWRVLPLVEAELRTGLSQGGLVGLDWPGGGGEENIQNNQPGLLERKVGGNRENEEKSMAKQDRETGGRDEERSGSRTKKRRASQSISVNSPSSSSSSSSSLNSPPPPLWSSSFSSSAEEVNDDDDDDDEDDDDNEEESSVLNSSQYFSMGNKRKRQRTADPTPRTLETPFLHQSPPPDSSQPQPRRRLNPSDRKTTTPVQPRHRPQPPLAPQLVSLSALPSASHILSINPATITIDIIAAVISISTPSIKKVRSRVNSGNGGGYMQAPPKKEAALVEVCLGDETKAGFSVAFWLDVVPVPTSRSTYRQEHPERSNEDQDDSATSTRRVFEANGDMGRFLARLRAGDVILLRNIALTQFRGKVQGHNLGNGGGAHHNDQISRGGPREKITRSISGTNRRWGHRGPETGIWILYRRGAVVRGKSSKRKDSDVTARVRSLKRESDAKISENDHDDYAEEEEEDDDDDQDEEVFYDSSDFSAANEHNDNHDQEKEKEVDNDDSDYDYDHEFSPLIQRSKNIHPFNTTNTTTTAAPAMETPIRSKTKTMTSNALFEKTRRVREWALRFTTRGAFVNTARTTSHLVSAGGHKRAAIKAEADGAGLGGTRVKKRKLTGAAITGKKGDESRRGEIGESETTREEDREADDVGERGGEDHDVHVGDGEDERVEPARGRKKKKRKKKGKKTKMKTNKGEDEDEDDKHLVLNARAKTRTEESRTKRRGDWAWGREVLPPDETPVK